MFERVKHHFDKGRCLSNMRLENGIVKCYICENVAGIEMSGDFHVLHEYAQYECEVRDFWAKRRSKTSDEESAWREVKQEISEMRLPEDPTYIPSQCQDEENIPFTEKIFDGEDSAAGNFYLGDDINENKENIE
jgi:hypothetical protein